MASEAYFRRLHVLVMVVLFQVSSSLAQSPTSTQPSESSQTQSGNGDGGGVPAGAAAPTSEAGANAAGASGGSGGSINLSQGSTIAIAVIVSIAILFAVASAVLYYVAKKRQWKVAETIRRSVRKVGEVVRSPLTPRTPSRVEFPKQRFPKDSKAVQLQRTPIPHSLRGRVDGSSLDMSPSQREKLAATRGGSEKRVAPAAQKSMSEQRPRPDLEKGLAKPAVTPLKIPQSSFDFDSPASGQASVWSKMFGRK